MSQEITGPIKPYKKDFDYSYTLGAFPTMELITARPDIVKRVYISSKYDGSLDFVKVCKERNIELIESDKTINRISSKENCFVAGIFEKFDSVLKSDKPHVLLVNVSDMGNLGTIIRTLVGFGIYDLGIVAPAADIYNPKVVRASMGAVFKMRFHVYGSFEEYEKLYYNHDMFPFMLDGDRTLSLDKRPDSKLFTLIYGNEASGLPASFKNVGQSIFIPQSSDVDSLNLPISVGVGSFIFTRNLQ